MTLASVPELLAELRAGRPVVMVDDENRENEGNIVIASKHTTPEWVNFMAREVRGLICVAITEDRASAFDRAATVAALIDPAASSQDFQRPGRFWQVVGVG